jgi:hypothetical protein
MASSSAAAAPSSEQRHRKRRGNPQPAEGEDVGVAAAAAAPVVISDDLIESIAAAARCTFCHQTMTFPVQASCCGVSFCELCVIILEANTNHENPVEVIGRLHDGYYYHDCLNCLKAFERRTYRKNLTLEAVLASIPVLSAAVAYSSSKIRFDICREVTRLEDTEEKKAGRFNLTLSAISVTQTGTGCLTRNMCDMVLNFALGLRENLMTVDLAKPSTEVIQARDSAVSKCLGQHRANPVIKMIQGISQIEWSEFDRNRNRCRAFEDYSTTDMCVVRLFVEFRQDEAHRAVQVTVWFGF